MLLSANSRRTTCSSQLKGVFVILAKEKGLCDHLNVEDDRDR